MSVKLSVMQVFDFNFQLFQQAAPKLNMTKASMLRVELLKKTKCLPKIE